MTSRTVTLWDPPITAKVYEQGDGDPVLFLHSGSGITPSDPVVAALAATGRTVIAPRHPGFVDPEELNELRDVHDLALYHDELFDKLGLESLAVIGHSFGGMVAAEFAAHVSDARVEARARRSRWTVERRTIRWPTSSRRSRSRWATCSGTTRVRPKRQRR